MRRGQENFDFDQMFRPIGQRNDVSNRRVLRGGGEFCATAGDANSAAKPARKSYKSRSRRMFHALADAFSVWLPVAPPASDFRRCGSFS